MQNSIIKVLKCFWFFSKFPPKRNSFVRNSFQSDIFSRFKYPGNIRSYQNKIHYIFPIYFSAFLFMLVAESNDFSPCHNQMLCCDSEVCLEKATIYFSSFSRKSISDSYFCGVGLVVSMICSWVRGTGFDSCNFQCFIGVGYLTFKSSVTTHS